MPELPEVETIRRGLVSILLDATVAEVVIRQFRLRQTVSPRLASELPGARFLSIQRRAKYLVLTTTHGTLILHLGMTGTVHIDSATVPARKHDHVDIRLTSGEVLRFHDPRRFGALIWTTGEPDHEPALANLGPEPLSAAFDAAYLYRCSRGRRLPLKALLMDQKIVVGVGNIYASEALFLAKLLPQQPAGEISRQECSRLVRAVHQVLDAAIAAGGTTLRDYKNSEGKPGYFAQQLKVYGREGEGCLNCGTPIQLLRIGQRSSFYCPNCQS